MPQLATPSKRPRFTDDDDLAILDAIENRGERQLTEIYAEVAGQLGRSNISIKQRHAKLREDDKPARANAVRKVRTAKAPVATKKKSARKPAGETPGAIGGGAGFVAVLRAEIERLDLRAQMLRTLLSDYEGGA